MRRIFWMFLTCLVLSAKGYTQDTMRTERVADSSLVSDADQVNSSTTVTGFVDSRLGILLPSGLLHDRIHLAESRLQLNAGPVLGPVNLNIRSDFLIDPFTWDSKLQAIRDDRNMAAGVIDVRQASFSFSPLSNIDVTVGRQIITWGTGDLLFVNDLFAKDFRSFFLGRHDEYLKAPSTAARASLHLKIATFDLVYSPRFGPDRFVNGQRLSYFDGSLGGLRGRSNALESQMPSQWFRDDEFFLRAYRFWGSFDYAMYYYNGFWKSPVAVDSSSGEGLFPQLRVYGTSIRGPVGRGILNLEAGYYHSPHTSWTSLVKNNEMRLLLGYEIEVGRDFTVGVQYYFEQGLRRKECPGNCLGGSGQGASFRDLIAVRITRLLLRQNLRISMFNFISPSDRDGYLRWQNSYKISDAIKLDGGINLFYGRHQFTFLNQFRSSSNAYLGMRYIF